MLEKVLSPAERKQLQGRVLEAFRDEMRTLSEEMQKILTDDLVTAFQNRMAVFMRIQSRKP